MKEYMFHIRNAVDAKTSLSEEDHLAFIKKCEIYIGKLKANNQLIAAQPVIREEVKLFKSTSGWNETNIDPSSEVQVGYYPIRASGMKETIAIAKENPEFEYVPSASIEVRPLKMKEEKTNFVYPTS